MKRFAATLALILWLIALPVEAQTRAKKGSVEQLAKALSRAYGAKALGRLDAGRPYVGKVKIIIEHSLADDDDKDRFARKSFKTLAQGEKWLRSREFEGTPSRGSRELLHCKKGVCHYDFGAGINHKVLFLQKFTFGYRNGLAYIKTIYLLDGD
jgi:hypothetical protein